MIALVCLLVALIVAYTAIGRYRRWRDRRDLIASPQALWAHTLPYEPSARERRQ
jgi:hypothetical protein